MLERTVFDRQLYAVGGNEKATRLSGPEVDRLKIAVYVVSAVGSVPEDRKAQGLV